MADDDVDLGDILAGGGEEEAEEEPTVGELIALGERMGVDLSFLAAGPGAQQAQRATLIEIDVEDVEDQLDAQIKLLQAIQNQTISINQIAQNVGLLAERGEEETDHWRVATFPEDPTNTIATTTELRETQAIAAGRFQQATADFRNTQDLVDLRITIDGERVVPDDSADADWETHHQFAPVYDINYEANGLVDVRMTWRNRDDTNEHRVPVFLEYTEAP